MECNIYIKTDRRRYHPILTYSYEHNLVRSGISGYLGHRCPGRIALNTLSRQDGNGSRTAAWPPKTVPPYIQPLAQSKQLVRSPPCSIGCNIDMHRTQKSRVRLAPIPVVDFFPSSSSLIPFQRRLPSTYPSFSFSTHLPLLPNLSSRSLPISVSVFLLSFYLHSKCIRSLRQPFSFHYFHFSRLLTSFLAILLTKLFS